MSKMECLQHAFTPINQGAFPEEVMSKSSAHGWAGVSRCQIGKVVARDREEEVPAGGHRMYREATVRTQWVWGLAARTAGSAVGLEQPFCVEASGSRTVMQTECLAVTDREGLGWQQRKPGVLLECNRVCSNLIQLIFYWVAIVLIKWAVLSSRRR